MNRNAIAVISALLFFAVTCPVLAQANLRQREGQPHESKQHGQGALDGQAAAVQKKVTGWYIGGFVGGLGMGPFGIAVSYAVAAESCSAVPLEKYVEIVERSPDYRLGFREGYQMRIRKRRKRSAIIGSLTGTAVITTLLLTVRG